MGVTADGRTRSNDDLRLGERIVARCLQATDHPDIEDAGCVLINADGALRLAASAGIVARSLAVAEELGDDGPCHDALLGDGATARPVTLGSWPLLAALLAATPIRTVVAVPVVCRHVAVGAFFAVSAHEHPWNDGVRAVIDAAAQHITDVVSDRLDHLDAVGPIDGPDDALARQVAAGVQSRPLIADAVAIIARQTGSSATHSARRLRLLAEAMKAPAVTVAQRIVAQGRLPDPFEFAAGATARTHHEELARLALTDPLTGLTNRVLLLDRLEHAVWRSQRAPGRPAVLYIDLDDFKHVNDTLGHEIGDLVLRTAATRIQASVRPQDTVGRLGGDEFAVVCEAVDGPDVAVEIANRIADSVAEPITLDPVHEGASREKLRAQTIGASIGIAVAAPGQAAEAVLRAADQAMYRSKAERTRVTVSEQPPRHDTTT